MSIVWTNKSLRFFIVVDYFNLGEMEKNIWVLFAFPIYPLPYLGPHEGTW
jgi:hypothetical protein